MSFFQGFFKFSKTVTGQGVEEIFPLALQKESFIQSDLTATYTKILTDVLERTHGIKDKYVPLLWDNCVVSEAPDGLITLLVRAMIAKQELFLVYVTSVNVLRAATADEKEQIRKDYEKLGKSNAGVFLNFKNYKRTDMLKFFSEMEYCILSSLHKTMNLSKSVQIKMSKLRGSVSLTDAGVAVEQAKGLALALRSGQDVFLDADDDITTATPDVSPTENSITFVNSKRAYYLDLPMSYVSGIQTPGIGSTGEADERAVTRGLKQYFFSIIQPTLKALFNIDTEFKSSDFREIGNAMETIKTFDLVSEDYISKESKRAIIARMFDLDPDEELKRIEKEEKESEETADDTETENVETPDPPAVQPDPPGEPIRRTPRGNIRPINGGPRT